MRTWKAACLVVSLVVVFPGVASAQRSLDRLERQLARSPDDTRLLCEVGWARFVAHADTPGPAAPLDRGIQLIGAPTERALQNRLAACLYSRGRVYEADGQAAQAVASYERSLALRPNDTVTQRLADLRAQMAVAWRDAERDPNAQVSADLMRALGVTEPYLVDLADRITSPDGRFEADLVKVHGDVDLARLALRERGRAWSIATITELMDPNGDEDFTIEVAPPPPGHSPTFVVRRNWENRGCCDDEGQPDWTEGLDVFLAWRGDDGAWSVAAVQSDADVHVTADGRIVVMPAGRGQRTAAPRPREELLRPARGAGH